MENIGGIEHWWIQLFRLYGVEKFGEWPNGFWSSRHKFKGKNLLGIFQWFTKFATNVSAMRYSIGQSRHYIYYTVWEIGVVTTCSYCLHHKCQRDSTYFTCNTTDPCSNWNKNFGLSQTVLCITSHHLFCWYDMTYTVVYTCTKNENKLINILIL